MNAVFLHGLLLGATLTVVAATLYITAVGVCLP